MSSGEATITPQTTPEATGKPRPTRARRIVRWIAVLCLCAGAAYSLAMWGNVVMERREQAHLQSASLLELQTLAKTRDWDPEVYYWLGTRLTEAGQHEEAVRVLTRSVGLNPTSAAANASLGLALARTDHPQEAEDALKRAIALNPKLAHAHFVLGNLYGKYKRWEEAIQHLKLVAALDPQNYEAQYLMAICYGEVYQEDRKMEILEHLVQAAPGNIRFQKSLGYVYLFFGKFAQAETLYRRILQTSPDDVETRYLLGRALAEQASSPEAFAEAERQLRDVAQKASNNPGVHLALGILAFRRNEPAKAIPELETAIRFQVPENKAQLYLGQSYMRVGQAEKGKATLAAFQKAANTTRMISQYSNRLLQTPDDTPVHLQEKNEVRLKLARVYMDSRDYSHALTQLHTLQENDAKNAEAAKLIAECETARNKAGTASPIPPKSETMMDR